MATVESNPDDTAARELLDRPLGRGARVRLVLSWLSGLLVLAAVILIVAEYGSLARTLALLRTTDARWVLLACLVQAPTYVCAAGVWWCVLRAAGHARSLRRLVLLGVAKVFTDQILPSGGVSGNLLVVVGLLRRHVPARVAMAALLVGMVSFYVAYLAVVLAAFALLWWHQRGSATLNGVFFVFVATVVVLPALVLWERRRLARHLPDRPARMPVAALLLRAMAEAPADLLRDPRLLVEAILLQVGVFLFDATTLWLAFYAVGQPQPAWIAFVAFATASMIATIAPIPLGLGSFEGVSIGTLHLLGVPVEHALAATLLLRGLTFWLPMLPGLWLARRELSRYRAGAQRAT